MVGACARLMAAAVLLAGAVQAGDEWPRFRGPNGSGVSESRGLPTEFGPTKKLAWKTAVPFGRSSPVVAGNRIFLTASEGEKLITLCLDRATGRILWRREIARPRHSPRYKTNDPASPTPVTDGKNVYAFFADLGLVSYDARGRERWRLPLGPFDTFYGVASSPILHRETLLLNCDVRTTPFLIAVHTATGKVRWRIQRDNARFEAYTTPVIHQPPGQPAQVVVLGAQRVDAYEVATGQRVWWLRGLASMPISSPVIGGGAVLVSTYGADAPPGPSWEEWMKSDANGDARLSPDELHTVFKDFDEFGALDFNSDGFLDRDEWTTLQNTALGNYGLLAVKLGGSGDLTPVGTAWNDKKNMATIPSPLVYRDVLYLVKGAGILTSMDPRTGEVFKTERSKEALEEHYASPVAADGKVYFTSEEGKVTVLKAGPQWEILAVNDLAEQCYATPAISGGRIFIRTRGTLYSFGLP